MVYNLTSYIYIYMGFKREKSLFNLYSHIFSLYDGYHKSVVTTPTSNKPSAEQWRATEEREDYSSLPPPICYSPVLYCLRSLNPHFHLLFIYDSLNLSLSASTATLTTTPERTQTLRHAILLDRIRSRSLKAPPSPHLAGDARKKEEVRVGPKATSFEDLGFSEEVLSAVREMGISVPTEIQYIGVPALMQGRSVVLGSHTGSGKTLAYLLPLVQLLRNDEAMSGRIMKPRHPRAVVLCPTRELCEQVFHVAKSISHHARFRSTMISGGGRLRPQEDSLNQPIDMVVGTPGRILKHTEDGNMVYGDIKYLVLDEADTMFDRGFGPDIRKFIGPLKRRASKSDDQGFQTILVTATMTKGVQNLVDEEFNGITHLRTSSLHKKIANARHDFIKLSGSENKLEALLQVLEPSLESGNRVMVFCNTLNSSRAVDHFLSENQISTVNYHGEVPAEQRVINLNKFKSDDGDCPTLVCTDLAARGLDLDVDHVIMFDFPKNSIDYLHRTGRTARMGAKDLLLAHYVFWLGKVTSLVPKKDCLLATRIEEGIKKNESLESFNEGNVRKDQKNASNSARVNKSVRNANMASGSRKNANMSKVADPRKKMSLVSSKSSSTVGKRTRTATSVSPRKTQTTQSTKSSPATSRSRKVGPSKSSKTFVGGSKEKSTKDNRRAASRKFASLRSKLSVVGFRGHSSLKKQTAGLN